MASQFLQTVTIASLIAPASEDEFRARYWDTKPLIVRRNDRGYYGDLFAVADFDNSLKAGPAYATVASDEMRRQLKRQFGGAAPALDALVDELHKGSTLVLERLERRNRKIGSLARSLAPEFGHPVSARAYLTLPGGNGFGVGPQNQDVFVLQVAGSRDWQIGAEDEGRANAVTLDQGDLMYLPRAVVHAARQCGEDASLCIALSVHTAPFDDLLFAAIKRMANLDPRLRTGLPMGFLHGRQEGVVKRAMAAFHAMADEKFLSMVVDDYRDELVQKFQTDISGQVLDSFDPRPLTLDDIAGPRAGIVYRVHPENDMVRLNVGARKILFPTLFRDSLEFALTTPTYAIREIKGDIEDEERIAFAKRLMEEGLLIRQTRS